jgi:hypothetical protein
MGRHRVRVLDHVQLLDEEGRQVEAPFLPLDAEFWNADRTRYTLFFDPGRVKRGLLPREMLGPSIEAGRRYTLVVDTGWLDAQGLPLREPFRRQFSVGPAEEHALDPRRWRIVAPAPATRNPLVVAFPEPLDHGLMFRALGVTREGQALEGDIAVDESETRWTFTPRKAWRPGSYALVSLSILEDRAGNRIGRPFDLAQMEQAGDLAEAESTNLPFDVKFASTP